MLSRHVPDLPALELLLAIGRARSLSGAAGELGITQQAASLRLRAAEARVGVPLVLRSSSGSQLAPAGVLAAQWASKVLDAAAELDVGIASLRSDRQAHLGVAASLTVAEHLLPGWLVALHVRQAAAGQDLTEIELDAANSARVPALVAGGTADVGFVEGPDAPTGLRSRTVATDQLLVVVPPGHPWAGRRTAVSAQELAATPLVSREAGSGTREALVRALQSQLPVGAPLAPPALELSSAAAVRAAVVAGAGPGALSSLAVADDVALGRLRVVDVGPVDLRRRLRAVWTGAAQPPRGPVRELVGLAGLR